MPTAERTTLISGDVKPQYAFEGSILRRRQRQVRNFQCCICTIVIFGIISGLVALATFTLTLSPVNNSTNNDSSGDEFISVDNLFFLPINKSMYHKNPEEFKKAVAAIKSDVEYRKLMDKVTPQLDIDSPSYRHQMVTATSSRSLLLSQYGYMEEFATKYYRRQHGANQSEIICGDMNQYGNLSFCSFSQNATCSGYSRYRTYDGNCNNVLHPTEYGVAYTPFRRILPPDYGDDVNMPRVSKDGKPLPSARLISTTVHRPYYRTDPKFTVMLAVWGQFLDHDITATALSHKQTGESISCCQENSIKHPECFPVLLSVEDPYYGKYNITCMEFVRSAPAPTCCLGPREQLNQVSAYIDGSTIYGPDAKVAMGLRTLNNGSMKMYLTGDNRTLLPVSYDLNDGCNREEQRKQGRYCFLSGDARANENLHLTSMHLIWARQHNSLASNLSKLNPHWDDERVFQEARRILAAQVQHITYNEFLRVVIGEKLMQKHDLLPRKNGYYHGYDDGLDASIANNFATAAFRFAHSLIPTLVHFISNDTSSPDYIKLHEILFDPFLLYQPGELDKVLKGAAHAQLQANDPYFSPELKQHLFERENEKSNVSKACGLDLVSLNIQRGRDHGLQGYVHWREVCGLMRPQAFEELGKDVDGDSLNYIQSVYRYVDDIDLYTGALSEKPVQGSILGPTLNCLLLDQFMRLKRGDRYWYENSHRPQAFTAKQLREIRKTTLAMVLCENSDNLTEIQPYVMQRNAEGNTNVACSGLKKVDLTPWKEAILPHVTVANRDMAVNHYGIMETYGTVLDG